MANKRLKLLTICLSIAIGGTPIAASAQACTASANVTTLTSGLDNPRGLAFGPDGALYVAEGGQGGTNTSEQVCPELQVAPPIGPYSGGFTSRISKISPEGVRTTVISGLPSSQTSGPTFISGVADVAFIGNTLYALVGGAGCTHGLPGTQNGIFAISGGSAQRVADLGLYARTHPTAVKTPDFEAEGTWYSMKAVRGAFYAVEPNHGDIVRVSTSGTIERVVDVSARYGHVVPTAIAYDGNFYVGTLGTFDNDFQAMVLKVTPSGETHVVLDGLTSITGLVVDRGTIYVLENEGGFVVPCAGRVLRVSRSGNLAKAEEVASGLLFPSAMTLGADGALYVSNVGYMFGGGAGLGSVARIDVR